MGQSDLIPYMMSFLKDYNYPLIHSMSAEEISDIFHISNRCFLISWILKLMDEETYSLILEDKGHDKDFLANLIYSYGFCSDKEKTGFFNGDLPIKDHVQILYRIFEFINTLKGSSLIEKETVSFNGIDMLMNVNLNIFPGFGDLKHLTEKEKATRIQIMQQEIQELQLHINCGSKFTEIKNSKIKQSNSDLQGILNNLNDNLSQFDRVVKAIDKDKSTSVKSDYNIDPQSGELLEKCNKNLHLISQYIEDLNTINNFNIEDCKEFTDDISPLIDLLAEQVQGISKFVYI